MVADDLGRQLGCYGATKPLTPHLDALAARGTRFTHAFASTASCSGSRSVIYTGLHTHQNGQYGLAYRRQHFQCFDSVDSAPAIFNRHGYLTGIIGKVHVGPPPVFPWATRKESGTRDVAVVADEAAAFFSEAKAQGKPFFLTVGFIDPHRDLTRAGFGNDDSFGERVKDVQYNTSDVEVPPWLSDLPAVRTEFTEYYRAINRMDQGVGMILHALKEQGYADDTLVIFLSDNGPPFVNSKTTLYDAGVNLPLLVSAPGLQGGIVNPNMISYVDILPTILEYSDINTAVQPAESTGAFPHVRLGKSFLPIITETSSVPGWDHVFGSHTFHEVTNYWPTRYIRTQKYKYHRNMAWRLDFPMSADIYGSLTWEDVRDMDKNPSQTVGGRPLKDFFFRPAEELYDLQEDPNEIHNLATDPQHAEVLAELRRRLEEWQVQSDDLWLYKDGVSLLLNQRHLAAGLKLPDRFDIDLEDLSGHKSATFVSNPWQRK